MSMNMSQLKTLRDELKLQAHLFNAELTEAWEKVQKDLEVVESETRTSFSSRSAPEPLLKQIEGTLERIREGVARNHLAH
jgi:hypothetical protein